MSALERSNIRLVLIGGGTGSFTLLSGLKKYFSNITAIVNMSDDGGSTGVLRDELGVLPPGDVRQCLVALSNDSEVLRELFNYRFDAGSLHGHSFGNLFLSALEKVTGSFATAVEEASKLLNVEGRVIPVTLTDSNLVLTQSNGEKLIGEFAVANHAFLAGERPDLSLEPYSVINPAAKQAIMEAEVIVIAPGHLYGSIAPALLADGLGDAITESSGKVVYVCNLVTKPGQTDSYQVSDYADEIERFIGSKQIDVVIYNSKEPSPSVMGAYAAEGENLVRFNTEQMKAKHYQSVGDDLLSDSKPEQADADKLIKRSLIRHNSDKIARLILNISS